jgi:tetratricopeptide (TPR) repeat protein
MSRRLVFLALMLLASCTAREKARLAPADPEVVQKISEADTLSRKGCFVALKQAVYIYEGMYARPEYRKKIAPKLAAAALLLAVREKELGMANQTYMDTALRVIKENRSLSGLTPYAEVAGLFWVQGKGVMRDIDERFPWKETEDRLKKMEPDLLVKAKIDEFAAYMYAVMKCYYAPAFGVSSFDKKDDLWQLVELFPYSLLLLYKRAICPEEKPELLKALLAAEPEFYEANYFLGNEALRRGNLLEAEGFFLKAHEAIPESPQTTILLAGIYLATEELERSLEFSEKTLALTPEYRDALLGKGICLSYLGRATEAIPVFEKIIAMGYWLLGESYYWLAWNQHELKDSSAAASNIEQAKGRLPTSSEVFTLSGILAAERGDQAKAEKDFLEALQYNPANSEALFNLGGLYSQKEDWPNSGLYFEKAGFAYENVGRSLEDGIAQVEKSALAPERKDRLLKKRKSQLERTLLTRATAFYDAAAGYFNAGQKYKALEMATRSAEHPAFKQKADELASGIK